MDCTFRWAEASDHPQLADVMFDAVRNGASQYDEAQRTAWVPVPRAGKEWDERLAAQNIVLAEHDGHAVGFMSLTGEGYLDFAFIRPAAQGAGLFRQLMARIEQRAEAEGIGRLWVHASLNAQPAFAAAGFTIIKREEVALGGQSLARFEMQKLLA